MATEATLLKKLNELTRALSADILPTNDRLSHIRRALRDHSRVQPRFIVDDQAAPPSPIDEFILPATFGDDNSVQWIEAPPDQPRIALLEPETQWRLVHTSTGYKIVFPNKVSTAHRIAYTLPFDTSDLSVITEDEEDLITLLAAVYASLAMAAYHLQVIRGSPGEPADLAAAADAAREARLASEDFLEQYRRIVNSEDIERGPITRTSEAAVRRLGHPIRHRMPRGQYPFQGTP